MLRRQKSRMRWLLGAKSSIPSKARAHTDRLQARGSVLAFVAQIRRGSASGARLESGKKRLLQHASWPGDREPAARGSVCWVHKRAGRARFFKATTPRRVTKTAARRRRKRYLCQHKEPQSRAKRTAGPRDGPFRCARRRDSALVARDFGIRAG